MLAVHAQVTLNSAATRALGTSRLEQLNTLTNVQPNLVEGKELNNPQAVALDLTSDPQHVHLYVSDTFNNRVLGWNDAVNSTNGQKADIVIGQSDFFTTLPQGPRTGSTRQGSGVTAPMGLVVDKSGNLYVIDAGNNRILRFPQPFKQTGDQFPDFVIGQQNFGSGVANASGVSASTLNFISGGTGGGSILQAYLKFDNFDNLWVADVGNQRVLRYPASTLAPGSPNGPSADVVLGQPDFATNNLLGKYDPSSLNQLNYPTGLAFDQTGRLFVLESQPTAVRSRILVFQPPFSTNQAAIRIIGTVTTNSTTLPPINESQLGGGAAGLFKMGNNIGVLDTMNNRLLLYNQFEQFTSDTLTQKAQVVFGQPDFNSGKPNRGNSDANSNTLQAPVDAAFSGPPRNELYIADAGNSRVMVVPQTANSSTLGFDIGVRLFGQLLFSEQSPNYIEGREFQFSNNTGAGDAGIVIDPNNRQGQSQIPHLYVADTYNNRILCFDDARTIKTGGTATFVIGQPDLFHSVVNYSPNSNTSNSNTPTQTGFFHPTGLAIDDQGNLWVADSGNGRVLRFPAPFAQPSKQTQPADLVLGQANFTTKLTDVSASRMFTPYGLAWVKDVGILVSDFTDSRVMLFPGPGFSNGMAASKVWGQLNFNLVQSGTADNRFSAPHGIAVDSSFRLYVADTGNGRILVFDDIRKTGTDPHGVPIPGFTSPRSVFIDQFTPPADPNNPMDELWIGDSGKAVRFYGGYNTLFNSNFTPDLVMPEAGGALAMAVDPANYALYVADIANRVVIHYTGLSPVNAASYNKVRQLVAPNTILSLFSLGGQFTGTQAATTVPLPTSMQSIQVLLNGNPVPLYYVSPTQINALIPNNAPTDGTADLQVLRTDNGFTLGDTTITMDNVAPSVFTSNGSGKDQVAAINDDGTVNNSSNPVARGHILQVFGTGVGFINGAPNDGTAVSGGTQTTFPTRATINGVNCPVAYSGLAPGQVGVWQVNVQIDNAVAPTSSLPDRISELTIFLNGVPTEGAIYGFRTTVWVKQ